jgi:hypothetical protein
VALHPLRADLQLAERRQRIADALRDECRQWSVPNTHVHQAVNRFPQLVGDYFDKRTVNYPNTVSRALGVQDTYLRYEFGDAKGNLHSHSVSASTSVSVMANRARERADAAEGEEHRRTTWSRRRSGKSRGAAPEDAVDEEDAAARAGKAAINRETRYRSHFARELHLGLTRRRAGSAPWGT